MHIDVGGRNLPPPAELAPDPAVFINREEELNELDQLLHEHPGAAASPILVVIVGLSGVGKRSLALKWLHGIRSSFGDGQLYADLGGAAPEAVLGGFLRALGTAPELVPSEFEEQVRLFRSLTAGRRLIVMLEDAVSAAQVRTMLPASASSLVLVTTRHRLSGLVFEGAHYLPLSPLSTDAALRLLERVVGAKRIRDERSAARELIRLCGRLPIAVCASAARLASRPQWSVQSVVHELASTRTRLAMLGNEDEEISAQVAFDVSYRALNGDEARMYRALGAHPPTEFTSEIAAVALDIEVEEAARLLDRLVGASMLQALAAERFRLHDLLHLHAQGKAADKDAHSERSATFVRLAEWYLKRAVAADLVVVPGRWHVGPVYEQVRGEPSPFDGPSVALDWLEEALPTIRAFLLEAADRGLHDYVWQLCEALRGLFLNRVHLREWEETHEWGLAAARESHNKLAVPRMMEALAWAKIHARHFEEAVSLCEQAVELWRAESHALGQASTHSSLGVANLGMQRPRSAVEHFARARLIHHSLGRLRGVALMTRRLGEAHCALGSYTTAVKDLAEASRLFEELGDRYNQARTLTQLGLAHLETHRPEAAMETLAHALVLAHEIGATLQEGHIHLAMADVDAAGGDRAQERDHLRMALSTFSALGAPQAEQVQARLHELPPDLQP
ncbi:NTPase [Sinosporangium siamense]|uniref:NTPase n=1 Tax=Sinosporangium siamense TaxID=1367973 RepID=A0A919V7U6_9ACTN|nr:NTPase [Sinosporangium siamense]